MLPIVELFMKPLLPKKMKERFRITPELHEIRGSKEWTEYWAQRERDHQWVLLHELLESCDREMNRRIGIDNHPF